MAKFGLFQLLSKIDHNVTSGKWRNKVRSSWWGELDATRKWEFAGKRNGKWGAMRWRWRWERLCHCLIGAMAPVCLTHFDSLWRRQGVTDGDYNRTNRSPSFFDKYKGERGTDSHEECTYWHISGGGQSWFRSSKDNRGTNTRCRRRWIQTQLYSIDSFKLHLKWHFNWSQLTRRTCRHFRDNLQKEFINWALQNQNRGKDFKNFHRDEL